MRSNVLLVVGVLCAVGAGCETLYEDAARNLTEAPIRSIDDVHLKMRLKKLARRAWEEYAAAHIDQHFSSDFAEGFRSGYADYLYEGGPGLPPAVPPFPYQLRPYETPQGHLAIDRWYAGFALGSDVARASGLREFVVIPLSQPPINAVPRPSGNPLVPPASPAPAELSMPRPVGPPDPAPQPPG